ncbi:MAG: hypothetical protein LBE76_05010 [Nitrososphaerota archaeon]|jgi:hypothetical protein|nr:hypothetical protein [Nitrososphaerota archaeon]
MIKKPFLAVFCSLLCLFSLFFSIPTIYATNNSFPSTFSITFQGHVTPPTDRPLPSSDISDNPATTLFVQLLDGTYLFPETVLFTFSIEETNENEYIVKFVLTFDDFYDEVTLPATVSEGRVYIDSTPTIFIVNPDSLIDGNTFSLYQTEDLTLTGTVLFDGRPETLIDNYNVMSKIVRGSYQQTDSSDPIIGSSFLFYDTKTGVLNCASFRISDVLLSKVGVASISEGVFPMSDYSENLDFTLVRVSSRPTWLLILIPLFVIVFVLIVIFAYKSSKKKKREKRKLYSNKTLKFNCTSGHQGELLL